MLGALLMNNRAYERVADYLLPDHFADPVNARIFEAAARMIDGGRQANPITLKGFAESDDAVAAAGGMKYVATLAASAVTVINAGDYGKLIYDLYLRRELIAVGEDMINAAFDEKIQEPATDQIEESTARLTALMATQSVDTSLTMEDAVAQAMDRWQQHDNGDIAGLSSGIEDLDRAMGLLQDGDLLVLSGVQAQGKTALALTWAYNAACHFKRVAEETKTKAKRVIVFSGEMSAVELAGRAMTTHTGLQGPRKRQQRLDTTDWAKLFDFQTKISGLPMVIDSRGAPNLSYMRSKLRQEQRKGPIGLIVGDYLQLMSLPPGVRIDSTHEKIGYNAQGFKTLATDFKTPGILISSMNRQYHDRESKRPSIGDLRGSGDIEYAADIVAFCHREEHYLEQNEPKGDDLKKRSDWAVAMEKCRNIGEVIIAKARHDSTGTARLHFERTRTLWSDIPKGKDVSGPVFQDKLF